MKLFGSNSRSRHSRGGSGSGYGSTGAQRAGKNKRHRKGSKKTRVLIIFLAVILALAIAAVAYWFIAVKPPDVVQEMNNNGQQEDAEETTDVNQPAGRTGQKYTFLAVGMDDGNGNTDTIMVATFDTEDYSLNVVSIPRDTLVNVSWNTKKVNSIYANSGIDGLIDGIADLVGYEVDFYGIIDLDAFVKLIDAIGGVDYYVPQDMKYSDPAQDLYIDFTEGMTHLNGEDAVKIMRFRSGYANADIGRIGTQQDFLMTVAEQLLANVDAVPITTLADVFISDVETDLTYGEIIWFARELLKMDVENITFHTLPANYGDSVNRLSYVTIYVDEWLEMINEYLNPFDQDITLSNLNILTRDPNTGRIYSTSGVYAGNSSWGNSGSSSSSSGGSSSSSSSSSGTGGGTTSNSGSDADTGTSGSDTGSGNNTGTGTGTGGSTGSGGDTGGGSAGTGGSPGTGGDTGSGGSDGTGSGTGSGSDADTGNSGETGTDTGGGTDSDTGAGDGTDTGGGTGTESDNGSGSGDGTTSPEGITPGGEESIVTPAG